VEDAEKNRLLRQLPSIDEVLEGEAGSRLGRLHGRPLLIRAARRAVSRTRERLMSGRAESPDVPPGVLEDALEQESRPGLRPVINATGVVLHTNLGRAPLARAAVDRLLEVAGSYSNLELDLATGERGSRHAHLEPLLCELTGAEAALTVNNNAGAVLLVLSALAAGREAIVSRGELVEIGGGFRIPDVMRQSGVALVEVGTTNKTRSSDYREALSERTALLVKVHRSNFAMVGFTAETSPAELAALGASRGIPLFHDLGSGCLGDTSRLGLPRERTVRDAIAEGASVVTFSGDKLLGGPQAGVIVGKKRLVDLIRQHPLHRALRIDKFTAAALEATLQLHRDGREAEIPAWAFLATSLSELDARADRLCALLQERGVESQRVATAGRVGGGAMPAAELPSRGVALRPPGGPEPLAERLRLGAPPVVARIADGALLLDVRTVVEAELGSLAGAVASALESAGAAHA
jgi:L-seryl-tRNA(Ser) seleniumtransferase